MARSVVSCGHDDDTGEAFGCSRPLSGSRTATIGIGRVVWFRFCRPILVVGRYIGFAVVMAQVRRPVPFRTRKLRPGRGDGTALERVWESSTPPHSTSGFPSSFGSGNPRFLSFKRKLKLRTLPYCNRTLYHRLCDGGLHIELSYALMTARIL